MNLRNFRSATIAGALGVTIIIAHIFLAIAFGLAASQWLGGAGIGLILVMAASTHILLSKRRQNSQSILP